MLTKRAEWHCFYFSDSEAFDETHLGKPPHWKTTHVHYISHRWGRQVRKEDVWRDLDRRSFGGRGAAHIKFEQTRP
jgi:hypothetical protein